MQDANDESIKSLEDYNVAWVEEARSLSHRSLQLPRPIIRAEGSQIWFSRNPRRKPDAVDEFLRAKTPDITNAGTSVVACGLMSVCYEEPGVMRSYSRKIVDNNAGIV
jgi:hypothetical protein